MANVHITGVAGFLGSHLADAMLLNGHKVSGNDNLIGGYMDNVPQGVRFYRDSCGATTNMRDIFQRENTEIVYHCAATAYEGLSVFSPSLVTDHIVGASVSVFSAAIACGVRRIVHCSSMARYGAVTPPFHEDDLCRPQDPYGIGKLCVEKMLINLCQTHGCEYVIAVPHNIIGPRQKYDDPYRNVASIMINMVLQGRAPIVYGDGSQKRCFSFIDDCLRCLTRMAFDQRLNGHVINIGPDEEVVTILELAATIQKIVGCSLGVQFEKGRPQEVRHAVCSSDKARGLLDYRTSTSLEHGLEKMVKWIGERGPKPFDYHLPLEIISEKTPKTWVNKLF